MLQLQSLLLDSSAALGACPQRALCCPRCQTLTHRAVHGQYRCSGLLRPSEMQAAPRTSLPALPAATRSPAPRSVQHDICRQSTSDQRIVCACLTAATRAGQSANAADAHPSAAIRCRDVRVSYPAPGGGNRQVTTPCITGMLCVPLYPRYRAYITSKHCIQLAERKPGCLHRAPALVRLHLFW